MVFKTPFESPQMRRVKKIFFLSALAVRVWAVLLKYCLMKVTTLLALT